MQKFKRGSRVRVTNADYRQPVQDARSGKQLFLRPSHRDDFGGDEGVIVGSYWQQFGGADKDEHQYTIVVLDAAGKPVNRVSWYDEDDLELVNDDLLAGHELIDIYLRR